MEGEAREVLFEMWKAVVAMMVAKCGFTHVNPHVSGKWILYRRADLKPATKTMVIDIRPRLKDLAVDSLSTDQVIQYMKDLGCRPATWLELLWWWIRNPDDIRQMLWSMVALGSVTKEGDVLCIHVKGADNCVLHIESASRSWPSVFFFLAVPIQKEDTKPL